jgi:hypothetical protein
MEGYVQISVPYPRGPKTNETYGSGSRALVFTLPAMRDLSDDVR